MALKVVGKREKRYDGLAHVTGQTRFVNDIAIPGMLTVKVFRSPVFKGKIKRIDISKAKKVKGVEEVITGHDVPNNRFGLIPDQPVLATDDVRFKGEPIVAVAACDEDTALEAVDRVKVDIEEEEAVFDPLEAIKPGAPRVRPEGNILMFGDSSCRKVVFGDIEAGFRDADEVIEGEYRHPTLEHAQLETQASLAVPEANGKLTIYTQSQAPYFHLGIICSVLQVPMSKVRYLGGTVGGGFGSKNDIHTDHVTAVLASRTGRPVKWHWTREEETLYSTYRGAWNIKIRDGVKKDGRIVARQIRSVREAGSYVSLNEYVLDKHCYVASGPYFVPNVYVEGYVVFTNKPPSSSMRGFGVTPITFATEVQMNKIAQALGMDPWEIRFVNAYREGDSTATCRVLDSVAMIEVMKTLAKKTGVRLAPHLEAMSSAKRSVQP
jgi:CO/xanthine dehydrogenase Mo-binding subunit